LKKLKYALKAQYELVKSSKINKNVLKSATRPLELKVQKKEKEVIIREFHKMGDKKKMPTYFKKIRKTIELEYTIENFTSVMNDLYFIISRMIVMDWDYLLHLYKTKGYVDVSDRKIHEIRNMRLEKLNIILLKGGSKKCLEEGEKNTLKIIMNCEKKHK